MPQRFAVIAVLILLVSTGCANMTPRQQRVLSGGATGATSRAAGGTWRMGGVAPGMGCFLESATVPVTQASGPLRPPPVCA
jgi:hypothetical protein